MKRIRSKGHDVSIIDPKMSRLYFGQMEEEWDKEGQLESAVGHFLLAAGLFCQKNAKLRSIGHRKHTSPLCLNGSPDLYVIHGGRYFGIEVKLPKGKQSPDQEEFEKKLRAAKGNYFICRSLDDAEMILKAIRALK